MLINTLDNDDTTLKDAINRDMDVSVRMEVNVEEEYGYPYNIQVLVSKNLGKQELVVGLEDLKAPRILHKDFPNTMQDPRRWGRDAREERYNSIRGDRWGEQMELKEVRVRGVLLEERRGTSRWKRRSPTLTLSPKRSRWSWTGTLIYIYFSTSIYKYKLCRPLPVTQGGDCTVLQDQLVIISYPVAIFIKPCIQF